MTSAMPYIETPPGQLSPYGVYTPTEVLLLQRAEKGWRGISRAEVRLALTADGWRASNAFAFFTGSQWGSWRPIYRTDPVHETREAAIKAMVERFHMEIGSVSEPGMQREAREIISWAESLCPAQGDLFGSVAA